MFKDVIFYFDTLSESLSFFLSSRWFTISSSLDVVISDNKVLNFGIKTFFLLFTLFIIHILIKLIRNPITSRSSSFLWHLDVEPIIVHLLENCVFINLMKIQKAINVLSFDFKEAHNISRPIHFVFHNFLKKLFNLLNGLLCFFIENFCDGHGFLILTNFLSWHHA